jgi:fructose/tagatose bisphosphate aldolase
MIVITARLYKVVTVSSPSTPTALVGRTHAKGISVEAELGRVEQEKSLLRSTLISIAHKYEKLGSAGQLDAVRASVKK